MIRSTARLAWLAVAALSTAALAACGGDDVLGPPDGAGCTAGSIAPGDSVTGAVTSSSCEAFDVSTYNLTYAESWTLHMAKNTAYVVRLRHEASADVADNWEGDLQVYARNAQGDVNFLTGWWDSFGSANGNGGENEELFLASPTDRTVSLRVSATSKADTGAYSLVVHSCPMVALSAPADTVSIDLSAGCEALTIDALPTRLSFWTFRADSAVQDTTKIDRTAGTGSFSARVASPAFDLNNWTDDHTSANAGFGTSATLTLTPTVPGPVAGWIAVRSDSAATVSLSIGATAPAPVPALVSGPGGPTLRRPQGRN